MLATELWMKKMGEDIPTHHRVAACLLVLGAILFLGYMFYELDQMEGRPHHPFDWSKTVNIPVSEENDLEDPESNLFGGSSLEGDGEAYMEELSESCNRSYDNTLSARERRMYADRFRVLIETMGDYGITDSGLRNQREDFEKMLYGFETTDRDTNGSAILITLSYPGDISGQAEGYWNYLITPQGDGVCVHRLNETGDVILTQMEALDIEGGTVLQISGVKKRLASLFADRIVFVSFKLRGSGTEH